MNFCSSHPLGSATLGEVEEMILCGEFAHWDISTSEQDAYM